MKKLNTFLKIIDVLRKQKFKGCKGKPFCSIISSKKFRSSMRKLFRFGIPENVELKKLNIVKKKQKVHKSVAL